MEFNLQRAKEILQHTPEVMYALLNGLSDEWLSCNEGPGTWTAFDVIGHLILCEETNFIVRTEIILSEGEHVPFEMINMTVHVDRIKGRSIHDLLAGFKDLRLKNISRLDSLSISDDDLHKTGMHPRSGSVKLSEVLATWVAHDLTHLAQLARILAKQYTYAVGPFREYLRILS